MLIECLSTCQCTGLNSRTIPAYIPPWSVRLLNLFPFFIAKGFPSKILPNWSLNFDKTLKEKSRSEHICCTGSIVQYRLSILKMWSIENTAYYLNYITVRMEYLKRLPNPPKPLYKPETTLWATESPNKTYGSALKRFTARAYQFVIIGLSDIT